MVVGAHAVVGLLPIFLPELPPLPLNTRNCFCHATEWREDDRKAFCRLLLTCRLKWTKTAYFSRSIFASGFCINEVRKVYYEQGIRVPYTFFSKNPILTF
jgi:hypothetical protein